MWYFPVRHELHFGESDVKGLALSSVFHSNFGSTFFEWLFYNKK